MIKRIRQFWRAIKAKLTVEDKVFIDKYALPVCYLFFVVFL